MLKSQFQASMLPCGAWTPPCITAAPVESWSANKSRAPRIEPSTSASRKLCCSFTFHSVSESNFQGDVAHHGSSEVPQQNLERGKFVTGGKLHSMDLTPTVPDNSKQVKKVLCLSNGHGEDAIAVRVLKELQVLALSQGKVVDIEALPLVGMGHAYSRSGFTTVGPCRTMPSGGFIYMSFAHLVGDLQAGLLSLTLKQWRAVMEWKTANPDGVLVAVGDIFPLALAWLVSKQKRKSHHTIRPPKSPRYAFIGTAKSEFYIRGDDGDLLKPSMETILFPGSIYLPWERHMMSDAHCRLVVPRDSLTVKYLKRELPLSAQAKVQDLGNPMMDGLEPTGILDFVDQQHPPPAHRLTILPGSREPEVHANWHLLLRVVEAVLTEFGTESVFFFTPIVPSLEPAEFTKALSYLHWQSEGLAFQPCNSDGDASLAAHGALSFMYPPVQSKGIKTWPANNSTPILIFSKGVSKMFLVRGGFSDCAHWANAGIAMAGTATEQLVGLGRPVFTIPGNGPQFSYAFAEAQTRLLGKSVVLCSEPVEVAERLHNLLTTEDRRKAFQQNGLRRMGPSGAAKGIARQLWTQLLC